MAVYASDYNDFDEASTTLLLLMGASCLVSLLFLINMAIDGLLVIPVLGITAAIIGTETVIGAGLVAADHLSPSFFLNAILSSVAAASLLLITIGSLTLAGTPILGVTSAATAGSTLINGALGLGSSMYGLFKMSSPITELETAIDDSMHDIKASKSSNDLAHA